MPATSETLATYAAYLVDTGLKAGTVRSRLTAVRARHRQLGHPVPDNVAAWSVLRGAEPTPMPPTGKGLSRNQLHAACEICPDTPAGWRNRSVALLTWDLIIAETEFLALDVEDVHLPARLDDPVTVTVAERHVDLAVDHDHELPDSSPALCPACVVRKWISTLALVGITSGPLWRPVDRLGRIEGYKLNTKGQKPQRMERLPRRAGRSAGTERLDMRSTYRIWAQMAAAAGLEVSTPRALRVGGARDRVKRTGDVGAVLARAGWSPMSDMVVHRLLAE